MLFRFLRSAPEPEEKLPVVSAAAYAQAQWLQAAAQFTAGMAGAPRPWVGPFAAGTGAYNPLCKTHSPMATGVDTTKLEALKASTPRKILAKVPDLVEVITGWRAWSVTTVGGKAVLAGIGVGGVWPTRKRLEAACSRLVGGIHPDPAPNSNCTCGAWAFKSLEILTSALDGYRVTVLGQVSLWGRVIEAENGFRAQYAYPKELWLFDNSLEELGHSYGVPVRTA